MSAKPKATRVAYGEALAELGERYGEVVALDADLSKSTKSELFGKKFPERFFQIGIAEQNMVGVAAGLASCGKTAFCSSFACFVAGRFETIKMSVAYAEANVKVVGTHAGVAVGADGYSQMGLEDVALMRALPAMTVYQPADDVETRAIVEYLCQTPGPAYLRLTRHNVPRVHDEGYVFSPGKLDVLRDGGEGCKLALFASGGVVGEALAAAEILAADGIATAVVNVPTIKPIDREGITHWAGNVERIVTIEDHNVLGGLGAAVAEVLAGVGGARLTIHGVQDVFGESASQAELYRKHGLDPEGIAEVARTATR